MLIGGSSIKIPAPLTDERKTIMLASGCSWYSARKNLTVCRWDGTNGQRLSDNSPGYECQNQLCQRYSPAGDKKASISSSCVTLTSFFLSQANIIAGLGFHSGQDLSFWVLQIDYESAGGLDAVRAGKIILQGGL